MKIKIDDDVEDDADDGLPVVQRVKIIKIITKIIMMLMMKMQMAVCLWYNECFCCRRSSPSQKLCSDCCCLPVIGGDYDHDGEGEGEDHDGEE